MTGRRGFGVRYDGGGHRCSAGRAADQETWLSEFLRDVVGDLREKVELLEADPEALPASHAHSAASRRRKAQAVPGEESSALQERVLELEAENSNLAGLLETITDALEEQEARCAAAEARADRLEQQLSATSPSVLQSPLPPPRSALRSTSRSSGGTAPYGTTRTLDTVGVATRTADTASRVVSATTSDLDSSSRRAKQLALLQMASQAAARPASAEWAADVGEESSDGGQVAAGGAYVPVEQHIHDAGSPVSGGSSVGSSPGAPGSAFAPVLVDVAAGGGTGAASTDSGASTTRMWQQDQHARRERLAFLLSAKTKPTTVTTEPEWGAVAAALQPSTSAFSATRT